MATAPPRIPEGRVPPHDLDAEQSVLGALLLDPQAITRVLDFLQPEDFYRENHAQIYRAALQLFQDGEPIDNVTMAAQLQKQGVLERIGGRAQLAVFQESVPTAANAEYYGRIVKEKAYKRRLIEAGGKVAALGFDPSIEADQALNEAQASIYAIADDRIRTDFERLYDLLRPAMDRIDAQMASGTGVIGVPTGFLDLDRLTNGLKASDLVIVAGRPSMGKTSWALNVALHAAVEHQIPVAIFSLEMSKEQLVERLLCSQAKIDSQRMHRGLLSEAEHERLAMALGPLGDAPIFIDESPSLDELTVLLKARQIKLRENIGMIVLDYIQLMQGRHRGDDSNRVQEVSQISRSLKALARELKVPVLAISQLSRAPEQRPDKRPILSDLRESGCVPGDTAVYLPDEGVYRRIDALVGQEGFNVLAINPDTWKLERRQVLKVFATGRKQVARLTTRLGRTVRATSNHRFLTIDGWKRLDELTPGIRVALPRRLIGPEQASLNDAELGLLGHLIGDGCTLPRHTIQYTTQDITLAEEVCDLVRRVFGRAVSTRINAERGWLQVYLTSRQQLTHGVRNPSALWLDQLGVFGLRSYEKFVPDDVFAQPMEGVACFLRHLWSTDGSIHLSSGVHHYANIYYASSSEALTRNVQSLLLRLAINATLRRQSDPGRGRDMFQVWVTGKPDLEVFLSLVGPLGRSKTLQAAAITEYLDLKLQNTNRDVIPGGVWRQLAVPAMNAAGLTTRQLQEALGMSYCGTALYKGNLSRDCAGRVATVVRSEPLRTLVESDVYWDEVKSIEPDGEEDVYDLTVDGLHNFVANDIVLHNSIEQDADVVLFIFRPEYYKPEEKPGRAEVIVAKHRNGPTGMVELLFRRDHTLFYNLEARRPEPEDAAPV